MQVKEQSFCLNRIKIQNLTCLQHQKQKIHRRLK